MDSPQPQFWEQQPDETAHAYHAFAAYRDLGITRSIRKAAGTFYGTGTDPKLSQINTMKAWSSQNLWVARAEAFDAHMDRERIIELEQARRDHVERAAKLGRFMQAVGAAGLRGIEGTGMTKPPTELVAYIRAGIAEERRALGLPVDAVVLEHRQGEHHDPEVDPPDDPYRRATDAMRRFGR